MRAVLTRVGGWLEAIPLEYRALCALFVISRLGLRALGLPYSLELNWMFLDDPARLEHHLLDSLVSFHVYPPGMNILTGLLLKLSPNDIVGWAQIVYAVAGSFLSGSLLYLLRAIGLSRGWALGVSVVFGLTPPALYFEHLYLYTYPTAALVCFGGACLHRALQRGSRAAFGLFFLCASLLCLLRSTFHITWFFALLALALLLCQRAQRRRVLASALLPLALLLSLYVKNYVMFDSFGATSAGGANLTLMTVGRMPKAMRDEWVRSGKLSPFAKISVYAPPRAYLPHFESSRSERWPELSALEHSTGRPNFNHWFFMEANRQRTADALVVLRARPMEYGRTVLLGLRQIFGPTTKWHPQTGKPGSPHYQHDQALGRYAALYNRLVHGWPGAPVGLYWLLPLALAMALHRVWQLRAASTSDERAELGVLLFCGFQIFYVVVTSSLFTIGESARYRFQIEAPIWILGAHAALRLARSVSRRLARRGASPAPREIGQASQPATMSSILP
jgi:hypothetical protein